jgi:hypothetical protein
MSERPCISVRGETYAQAQAYCKAHGLTMPEFVERVVQAFFQGTPLTATDGIDPAGTPDVPPASSQW